MEYHYGRKFTRNTDDVNERKFQKALQVIENRRMGVTNTEELPYYKIN